MAAALSPQLAIAYVREMSADVRAAVVLDDAGGLVAGEAALAGPARALLELAPGADVLVRTSSGLVCGARAGGLALVAVAGPLALAGPHALDARAAVEAAAGVRRRSDSAAQSGAPGAVPEELRQAAETVISATHRTS